MEPQGPVSRQRSATAWTALHAKAALQFAEKRQYRDLLHAIQLRPELAQQRDDFAMMPLHWLCTDRAAPLRVLQQVVLAFPEAATVRNLAGLLPLHMAVRKDLPLDALKTVLKFYPKAVVAETPDGKTATEIADEFVTSRSAKSFLHMLEQEVRSLSRVPTAVSSSSMATTSITSITRTNRTNSSTSSKDYKKEVIRGWNNGYPVSIGESGSASSSSSPQSRDDPSLDDGVSHIRPLPPVWKLSKSCHVCNLKFSYFKKRHHCRNCGESVCGRHSKHSVPLKHLGLFHPQRVCSGCYGRLQSHYTSRAIARLSPHTHSSDAVFEDTLPAEFAYSPPRQRQLRSRSAVDLSSHSQHHSHHPLLSPRHYRPPSPSPSPIRSPPPPPPSAARTTRTATLSPSPSRTGRTPSSTNTVWSDVSTAPTNATTTSTMYQPNFIKAPSGFSMHFTQVQRTDDQQQTVLDRQREIQRRRDRLAQSDLERHQHQLRSPRPACVWGSGDSDHGEDLDDDVRSLNNQSTNDDHELKLEMQMQKLLVAKKQITDALQRSKRDAQHALIQKQQYDKIADEFEQRGYSPVLLSSTVNDTVCGCTGVTAMVDSESGPGCNGATAKIGLEVSEDDNQHSHELRDRVFGISPIIPTGYSKSYDDEDEDKEEDSTVYATVPEVCVDSFSADEPAFDVPLDRAATWHELGVVLLTKGDFTGAAAELQKSVEFDPMNALAWFHLAKALDGARESTAAETAIHRSISLCPDSLSSLSLLGKLLNARGEHEEAIVVFRRALNLQCPSERDSVQASG